MTRPAAKPLGRGKCPCCGEQAAFSEAKTGRVVITCTACGFQGFARKSEADSKLRAIIVATAAAVAPAPAAAPTPSPSPSSPPAPAPEAPKERGWGLLG